MSFHEIMTFFYGLPSYGKIIIISILIVIIFALLKKFIKFAIYLALLTILLIVIFKLLA